MDGNGLKWMEMAKRYHNGQNSYSDKNGQKRPKMAKNGQKRQKIQKLKNWINENWPIYIPYDVNNNFWWQRTCRKHRKIARFGRAEWKSRPKTQKMHFLRNSQRERAEIKNLHSHICINVISSSGRFALPPLFGELEQRGEQLTPKELKLAW